MSALWMCPFGSGRGRGEGVRREKQMRMTAVSRISGAKTKCSSIFYYFSLND
jgi:hypothetical protein